MKLPLMHVILTVSYALLFFGTSYYWMGYHNVDSGQNMRWLNAEYNMRLYDINSAREKWSAEKSYSVGLRQMRKSTTYFVFSAFLFGTGLVYVPLVSFRMKKWWKKRKRKMGSVHDKKRKFRKMEKQRKK